VLGANSKDQIKFVHFDILSDIIRNSPELVSRIGADNVQEKEIRLRDSSGNIDSFIRPISSFSGIVSNIHGYTFSEMFAMKNPRFFTQLDGSTRNMRNALGVIDSTVSDKTHVLYKMYQSCLLGKTKTTFYSYRCSKAGRSEDFYNPNMTQEQLDDYKEKFPFGEFERYFMNVWEAGSSRPFTTEMIQETKIISADNSVLDHQRISEIVAKRQQMFDNTYVERFQKEAPASEMARNSEEFVKTKITELSARLTPVDKIYSLCDSNSKPTHCPVEKLVYLLDLIDSDCVICGGIDFADPMSTFSSARSVGAVIAKCLPGSRKNPFLIGDNVAPRYVYFLLHLVVAHGHELPRIKDSFDVCHNEYGGIDNICCERYGAWDLFQWCEERAIEFEPIHPTYNRQRESFREFYNAVRDGRFKRPIVYYSGYKERDILDEEMSVFMQNDIENWFGSPEKSEKYGCQDDAMFAVNWAIYAGRERQPSHFRARHKQFFFGEVYNPAEVLGMY